MRIDNAAGPSMARLRGFLINQSQALNALGGGHWRHSLSGSVGRACAAGRGWGPIARSLIELQPWFGAGHCAQVALSEAREDAALRAAGINPD